MTHCVGVRMFLEENIGSSAESVGDFGFGEFSKGVIQGGLQCLDVPKTVGFSHRQFRLEIQTLYHPARHPSARPEPVQ